MSAGTLSTMRRRSTGGTAVYENLSFLRHYDASDVAAGTANAWPGHGGVGPNLTATGPLTAVNNGVGTQRVVRFSAAGSPRMRATSGGSAISGATSLSIFAVVKNANAALSQRGVFVLGDSADISLFMTAAGTWKFTARGTTSGIADVPMSPPGATEWTRHIIRYDGSRAVASERISWRVNGASPTVAITSPFNASVTAGASTAISDGYWVGDVALLSIADGYLSDANTAIVDAELSARFGF